MKLKAKKKDSRSKGITLIQIVILVIGISIVISCSTIWYQQGTEKFFSHSVRFRGRYLSAAYFLIIGLLIFGFGLYDIVIHGRKKK